MSVYPTNHAVSVDRAARDRRLQRATRAGLRSNYERLEDRILFALTVTPYNPANAISTLTSALVKSNTGITVTSATYVGITGQGGTYKGFSVTDGTTSLALGDGVLLTSGLATNALGPNNSSGASNSTQGPSDADLTALITGSSTTTILSHDTNSITLTFTATAKTKSVAFDFVFGSEEFPEFVGSFNDAFGAFLDGKQISFDANKNPVTVNNNFFNLNNTNPTNTTDPDTTGKKVVQFNLQYDGLTPVLSTKANLDTTKTTHTLKLAIADAQDTVLDSGVFITQLRGDDTGGGGTGQPPVAKPGGPYTVIQGGTVQLNGSNSTDPNQTSASLVYTWDLDGDGVFGETGAAAANGAETGSKPTFSAGTLPVGTVKTVSLKVTDNTNLTNTATSTVTVISGGAVVANAGGPYTINEGSSLSLNASSSTAPAGATYSWDVDGDGTFGDATGLTPTLTWTQLKALGIIDGNATSVYTAKVRITSNGTPTISSGTTVTVKNVAPTANAGPDKTTKVNSAVTLGGSFTDPGDADTHTFAWSVKNPAGQVVGTSTLQNFVFTPTTAGTFTATLTVKDDDGGTDTDTALINASSTTTGPTVLSFTLVDADTDKDIMTLTDGITLDLSKLPRRLNVRANTSPNKVGSCLVAVNGNSHIERDIPYALFFDNAADYAAATFKAGNHTLAARAFTGPDGTGTGGAVKQIGIHVINAAPAPVGTVTSIILFNTATNQSIKTLKEFDQLDLKALPKTLGIRVTTAGTVGSVNYVFDAHNGLPSLTSLKAGWHTLTALPFSAAAGAGTLGASLQVRFFILV